MRANRLRLLLGGVISLLALATIRCASRNGALDPEKIGLNPAEASAVSGSWVFTMTGGEREINGRLVLLFDGGELSGRLIESDGTQRHLSEARVANGEITFTIPDGRAREIATGKFNDDTMGGTAKIERSSPEDEPGGGGEAAGGEGERGGGFSGGFGGRGHRSGRHSGARRPPPRISWSAVRGPSADRR